MGRRGSRDALQAARQEIILLKAKQIAAEIAEKRAVDADDRKFPTVKHESGMFVDRYCGTYTITRNDLLDGVSALESIEGARKQLRHFLASDRELNPDEIADIVYVLPRLIYQAVQLAGELQYASERLIPVQGLPDLG